MNISFDSNILNKYQLKLDMNRWLPSPHSPPPLAMHQLAFIIYERNYETSKTFEKWLAEANNEFSKQVY